MASFNDSIQQLLWPEKRQKDLILGDKVPGYIYRTTTTSYLKQQSAKKLIIIQIPALQFCK